MQQRGSEQVLHRLIRDVSRLGLSCQAQLRRIGTAPPLMTHVVMAPAKATAAKAAITEAVQQRAVAEQRLAALKQRA